MDLQLLTGSYDPGLVVSSVLIAICAAFTALELARQVTVSSGMSRRLWLAGGAMVMGLGIWAMHFIGMLAFSLPVPVTYDTFLTLLSLGIAMIASMLALWLVSRPAMVTMHWLSGGMIMGGGIAAMHYTGMMAMRMAASMRYDPLLFSVSIFVAVVVSLVALQLAFRLRATQGKRSWSLRLGSAVVMGFAIAGMHYTGMAATMFEVQPGIMLSEPAALNPLKLAVAVIIGVFILLGSTLAIIVLNEKMIARLLASNSMFLRQWFLLGAVLYVVLFWIIEAVLHAYVFKDIHGPGPGLFDHLAAGDADELWMRAAVSVTAIGIAVFGQRVFLHARTLHRQVEVARDHLEELVAARTSELENCERFRTVYLKPDLYRKPSHIPQTIAPPCNHGAQPRQGYPRSARRLRRP